MSLSLYKKFLIYKELKNNNAQYVLEVFGLSKGALYKIKREGFISIKPREKLVLDYVQREPTKSIIEISKELNLSKSFIYRVLKKYNIFVFKNSKRYLDIINFLASINDIENLRKFIVYYNLYNLEPEFILNLKEIPLELKIFKFEYLLKNFKLREIEEEIDDYLNELKNEGKLLIYYRTLALKFDVLILKKDYSKIIELYDKKIEKLISFSIRARLLGRIANAYSLVGTYKDSIITLRKLKKAYKKLSNKEKQEILEYVFVVYYNIGNYKLAYKNARTTLAKVMFAFALGKYNNVINMDFKNLSKHGQFIVNYAKALSYLFLGKPNEAISTMSFAYENMDIKEIEDLLEFYYIFLTIYHKFLRTGLDKSYFEELKKILKEKIDPHFYAIVTGDTSKLIKTPKSLLIKYWIKGRINRAIEISKKFGVKTLLYLLVLFQPKFYSKTKKYRILGEFLPLFKRDVIKLFILRKKPYFILKGKKHYLKPSGISLTIIELLFNNQIEKLKLNKKEINTIKYRLKIPIIESHNHFILNANTYIDFKEALIAYNVKNIKKLKLLFKSEPFSFQFHLNTTLNYIIEKCKKFRELISPPY
ncbi:MAG: hypothetical protein ABIL78_06445 [candidate division WOR-3 bacterium]